MEARLLLGHFLAKWTPVRVKKMRQNRNQGYRLKERKKDPLRESYAASLYAAYRVT
jgi:hypothetical protein